MFCMSCGKEINGKPQYCPWCGQPIGGGSWIEFNGSGVGFLGEYLIIALLSLITCGIYLPWGIVRQIKYVTGHTYFA